MRLERIVPRLVSDLILAILAVVIVYFIRFNVLRGIVPTLDSPAVTYYGAAAFPLAAILILVLVATGVYRDRYGSWFVDELFAVWRGVLVTALLVLAVTSIYRDPLVNYSRLTFGLWLVTASILMGLGRYGIRRYERSQVAQGKGALRAVVVGHGAPAKMLIDRVRMFPDCGYRLIGSVHRGQLAEPLGLPVLGDADDLRQIALDNEIDFVFIADRDATQQEIVALAETVADLPTEVRIVPGVLDIIASSTSSNELLGIPLLGLKGGLNRNPLRLGMKRAVDILFSAVGLILLSPVFVILGVLIPLTSPGPALIGQERVGLYGRVFRMFKFRSMRIGAEAESGPVWATPGDPRRTLIGKFIRRFSLDELPQLWNVISGDMSLVGPRPERPVFVEQFTSEFAQYSERLRLRPGLTGWAQVNDIRGMTPVEERLMYDLYYLEHWTISFDLKIMLTTIFRIASHKNAA